MHIPFFKYNHQKHIDELPKLKLLAKDVDVLFSPAEYRKKLISLIKQAKNRIYIIALYLEQDEAGQEILAALYDAKQANPDLDIQIFVDWHRAQRGRIGEGAGKSNADFYYNQKLKHSNIEIPIFGVPVNRREVLGVFHLKGSIIDDTLIYTGASINNVYLHKLDKYRYDRYHVITSTELADSMANYIKQHLMYSPAVQRLDTDKQPTRKQIKPDVKILRQQLSLNTYTFTSSANSDELSVTPLIGVAKNNQVSSIIHHLVNCAQQKVTFCTPYFNLPTVLVKDIIRLLRNGKSVEIIIGDKTANDFFIPEDQPFNIIGGLPYLYEINLRNFVMRLQNFIDNGLLMIRLWKDGDHTYHLKGVWVDDNWVLITGNNLNPRAWRLDLENGILIHDPKKELKAEFEKELATIKENTFVVTHYQQIQASQFYPPKVNKLIKRLSRIKIDRIIKRIL